MLRVLGGCGDDGGGGGQEGGEYQQRGGERGGGGERADQQWSAGVAEFAADFGCTECLSEPFGWGGGSEVGETDRGDDADPDADQNGRGRQPRNARLSARRRCRSR